MREIRERIVDIEGKFFRYGNSDEDIDAIAGLLYVLGSFGLVGFYDFYTTMSVTD